MHFMEYGSVKCVTKEDVLILMSLKHMFYVSRVLKYLYFSVNRLFMFYCILILYQWLTCYCTIEYILGI
jgi:hypothetical protein